MLSPPVSAQDFTGSWSLLVNGYKGEIYLKQEGSRVSGWLGVGGVNLDGDVIAGTVLGNEINFTRASPLLARPQEWRGFLSVHNNLAIEARRRATGADTMAGIGNHMGSWNFSWSATRVGPYREEPARSTASSASALTGTWNWVSGQTLVISANNTCEVYEGSRKINECRWESLGRGQYRLTHRDDGYVYVDTVTLSADGNSLEGTNNQGNTLHGSRR